MEILHDNLDKYKSYIQRRRVGCDEPDEQVTSGTTAFKTQSKDPDTDENDNDLCIDKDFQSYDKSPNTKTQHTGSTVTALRRIDPGPYQRLYGQNRKASYSSYSKHNSKYSPIGHPVEIEDNHSAVLAIRIIKQTLACFVILGIIVLMQRRTDTADTLAFIRKNIVEMHIEPNNLLTGVESLVEECSRFLGGSP